MKASWLRTVEPTQEPITLQEAKQHARILYNNDDATIFRFVCTARDAAEEALGRGLLTQTWQLALESFAEVIYLPMAAPLQNDSGASPSTALIVQYYDSTGALQTLATSGYVVDATSRPASVTRAPGTCWPSLQCDRQSARVLIAYVVGWTSIALIPERIKQGIRTYVAYLDCDREGLEENAARALASAKSCWSDKVTWIDPELWTWHHDRRHHDACW